MMNLYVDMDGVLAEYRLVPLSALYEPGYFRKLMPQANVVEGLKAFINAHPDVNVSVLSCIIPGRPYAAEEKLEWLEENCPFLSGAEKLFIPCGTNKKLMAKGEENFLLDDHSPNVIDFDDGKHYHGIKLMNGINGQGLKWKGERLYASLEPEAFAEGLYNAMVNLKTA